MIVREFDIRSVGRVPAKANTPRIVDADAVLTGTVALQPLQAIARGSQEVIETICFVEINEFAPCRSMTKVMNLITARKKGGGLVMP